MAHLIVDIAFLFYMFVHSSSRQLMCVITFLADNLMVLAQPRRLF